MNPARPNAIVLTGMTHALGMHLAYTMRHDGLAVVVADSAGPEDRVCDHRSSLAMADLLPVAALRVVEAGDRDELYRNPGLHDEILDFLVA